MIDVLKKLGPGGGVGFLIGLAAVWWIAPTTGPGTALLILICIVACGLVGGLLAWLFGLFGKTKPAALKKPATTAKPAEADADDGDDAETG
jgi:hypothetical protein